MNLIYCSLVAVWAVVYGLGAVLKRINGWMLRPRPYSPPKTKRGWWTF